MMMNFIQTPVCQHLLETNDAEAEAVLFSAICQVPRKFAALGLHRNKYTHGEFTEQTGERYSRRSGRRPASLDRGQTGDSYKYFFVPIYVFIYVRRM